jgi:branched-chain amino acid transport system ATP-binding protein
MTDMSFETSKTSALSVRELGVRYGALVALKNVSWDIYPGTILGIIGPNGAGKSSCYDAITAMTQRSGSVSLFGADVTGVPPYMLASMGLKRAFQQNAFFHHLTVIENFVAMLGSSAQSSLAESVLNPLRSHRKRLEAERLAKRQLVRFGIPETYHAMYPRDVPYGVQRMLSIALAYGEGAKVLLLDEPAAGLGGPDMKRLITLLQELRSEGAAVIVIEHHMELIMTIADHVCVLDLGAQLAFGSPEEIQGDTRVLDAYLGRAD